MSKQAQVLIAEDEYLVASMVKRLLLKMGHQVMDIVADGELAVEKACSLQPDLIIMDIEMPVLDGLSATEQIFHACPAPVIILTAFESDELLDQASAVGVGAYLLKPPQAAELERAIQIALARFSDLLQVRQLNTQLAVRNEQLTQLNTELQEALDKVKTLSGLLPICANCHKIRDDEGYWHRVEVYITRHTDAQFSHGLCPDCVRTLYPDIADEL